jgi:outer membrane protein insertion porin family
MRLAVLAVLAACGGGGGKAPTPTPTPTAKPAPVVTPKSGLTTTADQLKGPIRSVDVAMAVSDAGMQGQIVTLFADQVGKLLDRGKLRDTLARVLAMPTVADVAARGVQLDGGIKLIIDVRLQPTLRKLTAVETGGKSVPITGIAAPRIGAMLDPREIERTISDLHEKYVQRGYTTVAIDWHQVPVANGVEVVIDVTQGDASVVDSVGFEGNKGVASADLVAVVNKLVVPGEPVRVEMIERATLELQAVYWERGYANSRIKSPVPTGGRQKLVFQVTEGPVFKIGTVTISGDVPAKEHVKYVRVFGVKPGDIFKRSAIADGRDRVAKEAAASGVKNPEVTPLTKVDLPHATINLTLEIRNQ